MSQLVPPREAASLPAHDLDPADDGSSLSLDATRRVLHDLRVHQIELEMQNDELRRTQEQLELARARYFDLYDLAPVGYLTLNQSGAIREANLTAANLLNTPRVELVNEPLTRFIWPADQDIFYLHERELWKTGERQACELRLLKRDGEVCWVRLESTSTKGSFDNIACRIVMSDIDARRKAEETLRASELRHRILFENSPDALMTLAAPHWSYASGNSRTLTLFGAVSQADFVSHSPVEFSPERQPDGILSSVKNAAMIAIALRNGSHSYAWTYRDRAGRQFPASVLLARLEIAGQTLLQCTVRDETELRRIQAVLGQSDRLASMGMLAAGVAHEINNPLAYVLYNLESLNSELPNLAAASERSLLAWQAQRATEGATPTEGTMPTDDDLAWLSPTKWNDIIDHTRDALDGTQRIARITKAIGMFSRVESSQRSPVDLNYAIECAITMALNDIKFRAKLVTDFGALPAIWASVGKLSQIFLNLLINAAHALEEGKLEHNHIWVRTWALGENVFAEVKDSGKGISAADLSQIFEPFFTTKPIGIGSGLGLPICRNILDEFGGDIQVESELGKGTCFTVRLPIGPGLSQAPPLATPTSAPPTHGVRGRVLLIDDEGGIRKVMARVLGTDHDIVMAASGQAARAILEHDQGFDVLLCDLMMPEVSGVDVHQWLAKTHPTVAERVVFLSGGAFTPKAASYIAGVTNRQLDKPFVSAELKQLVADLVAAAKAPTASTPAPVG
jgi:two-component system cell cycle sensor histidine kinase/response regulator CckA